MIAIILLGMEILVVLIFVIHGVISFSLGLLSSLGEIDALAACTAATVDDVVGRNRFEVVSVVFVFIYTQLSSISR